MLHGVGAATVAPYVGVTLIVGNSTGACMLCSGTDCSAVAVCFPRTCRCTDKVCNERHTTCILITTPCTSQLYTITLGPLANLTEAGETDGTYSLKCKDQILLFLFWHWLLESLKVYSLVASSYGTSLCLMVRTFCFYHAVRHNNL